MMQILSRHILCGLLLLTLFGSQPAFAQKGSIRTTYKKYSFFTYQNRDILCEPYQVQDGEWLYQIFRKKGEISERDFPLFLKIFSALNPEIHNINTILPGTQIIIPLKSVSQRRFAPQAGREIIVPVVEFSRPSPIVPVVDRQYGRLPPLIWEYHFNPLKRYAQSLNGKLKETGVIHFPPGPGHRETRVDFSRNPVIQINDRRLVFHAQGSSHLSSSQLEHMRSHWGDVSLKGMTQVHLKAPPPLLNETQRRTIQKQTINRLLTQTLNTKHTMENIPFLFGGIKMSVVLHRVMRKGKPDLLINYGTLHGQAGVAALEKMGFDVFNIPSTLTMDQLVEETLHRLGFRTLANPSFVSQPLSQAKHIREIHGILAQSPQSRHFFAWDPLDPEARQLLKDEKINLHYLH